MSSELIRVETPWLASHLRVRMCESPGPLPEDGFYPNPDTPAGFEDVIPGGLGTGPGRYFNQPTSTHQLRIALAISPHADRIQEIVMGTEGSGMRHLMAALRAERVLDEMEIADLGSGEKPGFAVAASTIGARVHTIDAKDLDPEIKKLLASHTVVDLSEPETALAEIQRHTGGELDLVTTNILSKVQLRGYEHIRPPHASTLKYYGAQLLKSGGYYFDNDRFEGELFQKPVDI